MIWFKLYSLENCDVIEGSNRSWLGLDSLQVFFFFSTQSSAHCSEWAEPEPTLGHEAAFTISLLLLLFQILATLQELKPFVNLFCFLVQGRSEAEGAGEERVSADHFVW